MFNDEPGVLELGYSLEHHYWGQGFATEMAKAMISHAFTAITTRAIVVVTTLNNTASQRVLEKAGLKRAANLLRDGEELAFFKTS